MASFSMAKTYDKNGNPMGYCVSFAIREKKGNDKSSVRKGFISKTFHSRKMGISMEECRERAYGWAQELRESDPKWKSQNTQDVLKLGIDEFKVK
jgi:hypothetical protein